MPLVPLVKRFTMHAMYLLHPDDRITEKVSFSHVNEAFNEELQADFTVENIRGRKYEVMNVVDLGTAYGERVITPAKNAETMKKLYETS